MTKPDSNKEEEKLEPSHTPGRTAERCTGLERIWQFLRTFNTEVPYDTPDDTVAADGYRCSLGGRKMS